MFSKDQIAGRVVCLADYGRLSFYPRGPGGPRQARPPHLPS